VSSRRSGCLGRPDTPCACAPSPSRPPRRPTTRWSIPPGHSGRPARVLPRRGATGASVADAQLGPVPDHRTYLPRSGRYKCVSSTLGVPLGSAGNRHRVGDQRSAGGTGAGVMGSQAGPRTAWGRSTRPHGCASALPSRSRGQRATASRVGRRPARPGAAPPTAIRRAGLIAEVPLARPGCPKGDAVVGKATPRPLQKGAPGCGRSRRGASWRRTWCPSVNLAAGRGSPAAFPPSRQWRTFTAPAAGGALSARSTVVRRGRAQSACDQQPDTRVVRTNVPGEHQRVQQQAR